MILLTRILVALASTCCVAIANAQVPPSSAEIARYTGLLAAAAKGDAAQVKALIARGEKPDVRDAYRRFGGSVLDQHDVGDKPVTDAWDRLNKLVFVGCFSESAS